MISPQYVDGLELRIEELASELRSHKAALAGLQQERDALAAHVERCRAAFSRLSEYWNGCEGMAAEYAAQNAVDVACDMLEELPETSLARLITEKQAEALERAIKVMRQPFTEGGAPWLVRVEDLQAMADDYRRQAEERIMSTATDKYTVDWCRNNPDKAHLLIQHYEKCWGDASQACNDVAQERDAMAAHVERLNAFRSAVCGWRENDWPEGFCRRTAEMLADRGRQAEGDK